MLANNLIFFSIWWIFFRQFDNIAGWKMNDMIALMAIGTGAYGLMLVGFGGVKDLSRIILNGDLDPFMTQPKNLLMHLAMARSQVKGWGQLLTAVVLIIMGGFTTMSAVLLIIVGMLSGCLVFTSIAVIAHSLPFWMGTVEGLSKKYFDAVFLFALYPTNIYSGVMQIVMFTLIPAGIIGYLPVELLRDFSWIKLLVLLGSAIAFVGVAFAVFYAGLKRYESGNKFGVRL